MLVKIKKSQNKPIECESFQPLTGLCFVAHCKDGNGMGLNPMELCWFLQIQTSDRQASDRTGSEDIARVAASPPSYLQGISVYLKTVHLENKQC